MRPIRHRFPFEDFLGFLIRSGSDPEYTEIRCFPLPGSVSMSERNGLNACSVWVWDKLVRALSAYA